MIDVVKIWEITQGGRTVIEDLYPQSHEGFECKQNFKIRNNDKTASCVVFLDETKTFWFLQDKGGSDNKAKNAILLIQEHYNLDYYNALQYIDKNYCSSSTSDFSKEFIFPEATIKNMNKEYTEITFKRKSNFTEFELQTLGKDVTPEICKEFKCTSLDYFITKNGFKIKSNEKYPIYLFDYGDYKQIYQPLSKKNRFFWIGKKPTNIIFLDSKAEALYQRAENHASISVDEKIKDLIICTGKSDAMTVYAKGFNVCWMNSETAILDQFEHNKLSWICENLYNLPDIDSTGKKAALKLGMQYLDIKIIWLPDKLRTFRDWKGKSCKDVKDFFKHYYDQKWPDLQYYFKKLVETSFSLKFWNNFYLKSGIKYEINNEQSYAFLNANGFYTMESKSNKKEFVYIHITDNIVEIIADNQIVQRINAFLLNFLRENLNYYDIKLINTIHRSDQLRLSSLSVLSKIDLDFKCYGAGYDHLFFKNVALRINNQGIETYKTIDSGVYVLKDKIIDFDFVLEDRPFDIEYSDEYKKAIKKKETLDFPDLKKFKLTINDTDFSIIRYLYNTGRVHWKKEERGEDLTNIEQDEHDLHFISKVCALGFSLYRYKERGMPYFLYAMETEFGILGSNRGGTGKSFFFSMIEQVRNAVTINGRRRDLMDDKHIFSQVVKDITDFVYYDDIGEFVDLHIFLSAISGKMEIRPLFIDTYMLDYEDSPKLGGSSNHSVRNIDPSIRRRLWFLGFSDYYHHEDKVTNIPERSIRTEFGKNLLQDFNKVEWNKFHNLMAWCMHFYLKFNEKINPPIEQINQRNIQGLLGDEFIDWADSYFNVEKLNTNVDKSEAYEDFLERIPDRARKYYKRSKFKEKLKIYAEYKDYVFNPLDLFKSESEIKRNDIRETRDGKDVYYFHFRTKDFNKDDELPIIR